MLGIILIIGIIGFYIVITLLNGRTEIPAECKDLEVDKCSSCHTENCSLKEVEL